MAVKNKIYDALIVGSSIPALCSAIRLQQMGQSTLIIEEQEDLGGIHKPVAYLGKKWSPRPFYVPDNEDTRLGLDLLKIFLPDLAIEAIEQAPITYQNGQTQPFLGFGSLKPEALDLYSYYLAPKRLRLSLSAEEIVSQLKEVYTQEQLPLGKVTKIEWEDLVNVTLNGSQNVRGRHLYFFESPKTLSNLVTNGHGHKITKASTQKLGKSEVWASLNMLYHHTAPVSESPAMHFLYGAKEILCLGQHYYEKEQPFSHWMTAIPAELSEDSEHVGSLVKELKRQIKRMFPNFFDSVEKEFIHVQPESFAYTPTGLLTNGQLAKEERATFAGPFFSPQILGVADSLAKLSQLQIFIKPETTEVDTPTDAQV